MLNKICRNPMLPSDVAQKLQGSFLHRPFGAIRFWRFAVVRPHDQMFEIVSVAITGERLDLSLHHASHSGHTSPLSVWSPAGITITDQGVIIRDAARLQMDDNEAWHAGDAYCIRTPRGEGSFPRADTPALALEV